MFPFLDSRFNATRVLGCALLLLSLAATASAQSLRGSPRSLDRQSREARLHDFTYLRRPGQLERFVDAGLLVPVVSTRDYRLSEVSFEVARPEVKLFLDRFGTDYRRRCGERMVVTSLTRPTSRQPNNASVRSVHPTGMAVDLRRPSGDTCRRWLESRLMALEQARVLEATREQAPPHYHIAIFPEAYAAYAKAEARATSAGSATPTSTRAHALSPTSPSAREAQEAGVPALHTVKSGETLWRIAHQHGLTVAALQRANGLSTSAVAAGQSLLVPSAAARP